MTANLEAAREYLARGWSVIPVAKQTKVPVVKWEKYQKELPSEKDLDHWFKNTDHSVGIVTGKLSNLVVLDVDEVTPEWVELLLKNGFPTTLTVKTGRGQHFYFTYPSYERPNAQGAKGDVRLSVDIRGEGGYVVAPPSWHSAGSLYVWDLQTEPAEWLEWLNVVGRKSLSKVADRSAVPAAPLSGKGHTPYGNAALKRIFTELPLVTVGERNESLLSFSRQVGQLLMGGQLDISLEEEIQERLIEIGAEELEQGFGQARATVMRGLAYGKGSPAGPEEDEFDVPLENYLNGSSSHLWIAKKWIPAGFLTILSGQQKVGKGLICSNIIAGITTGTCPGDFEHNPRKVLISYTEDDYTTDVIPRIRAAGGETNMIRVVQPHHQILNEANLKRLERRINETESKLVVLDQLADHVPHDASNDWQNQDGVIRPVLVSLQNVAKVTGAGIIGILHDRKGFSQGLEAVAGAQAWTAVARVTLKAKKQSPTTGKVSVAANNIGIKAEDKTYIVERKVVGKEEVPYITFPHRKGKKNVKESNERDELSAGQAAGEH